ncbi:MAG TPA: Hsp20/alpha crystallin family protein [Candidatus Sulfopaludibacter sp.]|nr:Hsp20/alpha crystallin family protein [Candidatus Sulfopaludibacter sp.]
MNATNKITVVTGLIALVAGLGIGVGAAELEKGAATADKNTSEAVNQPSPAIASGTNATVQAWDPFQQIRDMQMQMDKMFSQMSAEFRAEPPFSRMMVNPTYSLSLSVEDLKDRYLVRAFLPDTKVSDVNVKLNNQTLKVDVSNQQIQGPVENKTSMSIAQWGQYEQVIQLPTPVKASQMQVERKDHELLITLPKE